MDLMSTAIGPAPDATEPDDGLLALVSWRLADPAWKPSFRDLLDDARACVDPAAGATVVLAALRDVVTANAALAPRARIVALEAQNAMSRRDGPERGRAGLFGRATARLFGGLRASNAPHS